MNSFILISASLLCSFSWISVSESQSQTVDAQPGEDVPLQCPNEPPSDCLRFWFRLVNRTTVRCIVVLASSSSRPKYCDGYHKERFEVTTSSSTVKIKTISVSDSGMYFCGYLLSGVMKISVIHLNVKGGDQLGEDKSEKKAELQSVILGSVALFFLLVIIGLVVKICYLHKGQNEEQEPQRRENLHSDDLNLNASVRFNPGARRRELEPHAVYAATR